jgi:hypothetical protein
MAEVEVKENNNSEGIKRKMEEQPAMKKTGSKRERTTWRGTWKEIGIKEKENNQNGTVTKGHMKRPQNE